MCRGIDDDLSVVGWVGVNLLVAGHAGVEADFSAGRADFADGGSLHECAVLEEDVGFLGQGVVVNGCKNNTIRVFRD